MLIVAVVEEPLLTMRDSGALNEKSKAVMGMTGAALTVNVNAAVFVTLPLVAVIVSWYVPRVVAAVVVSVS